MDEIRWQEIKDIFDSALELDPSDRDAFVAEACRQDPQLKTEVGELLYALQDADRFLEDPASESVADLILSSRRRLDQGQMVGHYEIVEMIGAGGVGEVYLANDTRLGRMVAVKILNDSHLGQISNVNRFTKEAIAASSLNHPNILVIHETGESEGLAYIVSEYVQGESLRDLISRSPLAERRILDIAIQISYALDAAHSEGIIHRDIKPDNIMIRPDGYVKVLDFGLAKLFGDEDRALPASRSARRHDDTEEGLIVGTVRYMSPEQARGEKLDFRSDIFGFGTVLYEMMFGRTPFEGETPAETVGNILDDRAVSFPESHTRIDTDLIKAVRKLLEKEVLLRYQSMAEVISDLAAIRRRRDFEAEFLKDGVSEEGEFALDKANPRLAERRSADRGRANSVAVLPFSNLSSDQENEYFCDGLAEELLNALSKIERLKVAARTSSFSFKKKEQTLKEIAEILKVKTVVEGSVRRSGDMVRINVQLVNAEDGFQIWSERYDRELRDIYSVQDEITLAVADALKIKLLADEEAAVFKRYTQNTEAYLLYLKGVYYRWKLEPAEFSKCREFFQKAIDSDPLFAPAYFGLASFYGYGTAWGMLPIPTDEGWLKAESALAKAREIDDSLPEIRLSLGAFSLVHYRDWKTSGEFIRQTAEHAPDLPEIHHLYGFYLLTLGEFDRAIEECRTALNLDPLSISYSRFLGICLYFSRRYREAIRQFELTLELDPDNPPVHYLMGEVYAKKSMFKEAASSFAAALDLEGRQSAASSLRECADEISVKKAVAEIANADLAAMEARSLEGQYVPAINFARSSLLSGNAEAALGWLERSVEETNVFPLLLNVDPFFDHLRADPRFGAVLEKIGFDKASVQKT